ncbi:MAG: LptF/LptG family permease [Candidatus Omnitrophica bacterium]|nr:LptF/LptG family permease [Candidatus Omnitrophota bacterium]
MRKIEQYIAKKILSPLIFCSILMISIYLIVDLSTKLEHIIKNNVAASHIIYYYIYSMPKIIFEITPLCFLVSVIYSMTKMNKANEIIAMRASGIGFVTIFKPYFLIAILLVTLMFWNHERIIPFAYEKLKNLDYILEGKEENRTYKNITFYSEDNKIIFAQEFHPEEKILNNIVILEQNIDKTVLYKITAQTAHYQNNTWILYNPTIFKLNPQGTGIEEAITLSKKEYDFKERPEDILTTDMELSYQPLKKLLHRMDSFKSGSPEIIRRLAIELYHNISFPFTNIVLLLLGLSAGLRSQQASLLKGLAVALLIGFAYYALDAFSYSLGKIGFFTPFIGGFFANIFFFILGGYLLIKTMHS